MRCEVSAAYELSYSYRVENIVNVLPAGNRRLLCT